MKNGICPKCKGKAIVTNKGLTARGDRSSQPIDGWNTLTIHVYICTSCGFFEEYVEFTDKSLEKLKSLWKPVRYVE